MRNFFVTPLIAADDGDAEHFDLWRLDQQQQVCMLLPPGPSNLR